MKTAYLPIFLRSIWLAVVSALICLVVGYPVAWCIAQTKPLTQRFLYMLVMLPMCISFLLRTLAWVSLLEDTGIINRFLGQLGIGPLRLVRTDGAVILGMVYNYLPYMIMPLYTVIMKIDRHLVEAAQDLGCTSTQAFFKVVLHEIFPGIVSGALMAFTMSLDDFVISYFVYGPNFVTLPVEIYNYTKKPLHPKIYALFTLLFLAILLVMLVMNILQARDTARHRAPRLKAKAGEPTV